MSDAQGHLKLKVKKKNVENSLSRTGMKSPNNERSVERRERERERKREQKMIEVQEPEITVTKENRLAESAEGLDIDSRFQLQDQPSRISIVSR